MISRFFNQAETTRVSQDNALIVEILIDVNAFSVLFIQLL
jgi:hypothetical protein